MQKKEITIPTKKRLAKIFVNAGEGEQQVEFQRQNLSKISAFEPYASFKRIDRLEKGFIDSRDLANFMRYPFLNTIFYRDNGFDSVDENDCKHVIRYFDSTEEERLHYTE